MFCMADFGKHLKLAVFVSLVHRPTPPKLALKFDTICFSSRPRMRKLLRILIHSSCAAKYAKITSRWLSTEELLLFVFVMEVFQFLTFLRFLFNNFVSLHNSWYSFLSITSLPRVSYEDEQVFHWVVCFGESYSTARPRSSTSLYMY